VRAVGPGGLIVPGPVLVIDADTAAAVVDLLCLEVAHRRLFGRDAVADNALAAMVALARTAERFCSDREEVCSADVPAPCGDGGGGGRCQVMTTATADEVDVTTTAAQLGVGPRAVRSLAGRRTLPGWKVGGRWRFARADVDVLADRRAQRRRGAR